MDGSTINKAIIGAFGPPLTVILLKLDEKLGWGLGSDFWAAVIGLGGAAVIGYIAWRVPNKEKTS